MSEVNSDGPNYQGFIAIYSELLAQSGNGIELQSFIYDGESQPDVSFDVEGSTDYMTESSFETMIGINRLTKFDMANMLWLEL